LYRCAPEDGESMRKFYVSLRKQKPESEMAELWLMEHGLLSEAEADKAFKRWGVVQVEYSVDP
jgi:hypothetical protein